MFSNVNKTFSQLVTKPCFKSTTWHNTWIDIMKYCSQMNTYDVRMPFVWLKVHAIRDGMKFTWKYPDLSGLFLDGIAVFSREAGKRSTTGYKFQPVIYLWGSVSCRWANFQFLNLFPSWKWYLMKECAGMAFWGVALNHSVYLKLVIVKFMHWSTYNSLP